MSTVSKALTLLDVLSRLNADAGLTELAQACGYDKATARRFLVDLGKHGFVEQLSGSRKYRIGAEPMRLARIREARYPLLGTALSFVKELAQQTGETVHLSEFSSGRLSTIHVEESSRAHRVFIDVGTILPYHATASGLAYLAASSDEMVNATLSEALTTYTEFTIVDTLGVWRLLKEARVKGFSVNQQGLESGVVSASSAIMAPTGKPVGCITVAAPLARADEAVVLEHGAAALHAAKSITAALFGEHQYARHSSHSQRGG